MSRRPADFQGFVGQRRAVRFLEPQLKGAVARSEPLPHLLILGPSGVGKTRLATSLASAYGSNLIVINGHDSVRRIAAAMTDAVKGDLVFIDECHALSAEAQHLLLEIIDKRELPKWAVTTEAKKEDSEPQSLQEFTVVLATDRPGRLFDALQKRMDIRISLSFYSLREMREICDRVASDLPILVSPQARNLIAQLGGGLPRKTRHLLQNMRRHFPEAQRLAIDHVRRFMKESGIDSKGLDSFDRRYLKVLLRDGATSVEGLASSLGCDVDHLRRHIEPSLRRLHLIRIASRGRQLTELGKEWISRRAAKERKEV